MSLPTFAAMVIAINIRILSGDEAATGFLTSRFEMMAAQNRRHQFYFISNKEMPASSQSNVKNLVIGQRSSSPLLWKMWYNYKLPATLKKIKANLLVSAGGIGSLTTKLPQCILINDLAFVGHPEWYSKRYVNFMKAHLPLALNKVAAVLTFSEAVKNELVNSFAVEGRRVILSAPCVNSKYKPLSWDEKEKVKNKYSGGKEYFLFRGEIHDRHQLTNLLKAFSLFKKRQKSSMQLLLVSDAMPAKNAFAESLRLYKYRDEVHLLSGLPDEESICITGAAWCAVGLSPLYNDIQFLQEAVLCEVPVLAGNEPQAIELLKDAALYANPASIDSIAEQLMVIYKDEKRHTELVDAGRRQNKEETGDRTWEMILSLANTG